MVNFEDGTTIARNKKEIQELTTLQRRYETISAIKEYKEKSYKDGDSQNKLRTVQSTLIALYYEIDSVIDKNLQKKNNKTDYTTSEEIEKDIESGNEEQVFKAWKYINKLLYTIQLTKLDSKKDIDWTDPEEVNEEHEL